MDKRWLIALVTASIFGLVLTDHSALPAQQQQGKGKFLPGSRGGVLGDASKLFDMLAQGESTLTIANAGTLRRALELFARNEGITSGELTRAEFARFNLFLTNRAVDRNYLEQPT